nr:hypothetical protein [Tanacetum cinerariifolium]
MGYEHLSTIPETESHEVIKSSVKNLVPILNECEVTSDNERTLTSIVMNDISDNSTNDPLLEEVDLFLASDNSIPSGIENFDYDSEGDIHFLEKLLVDDSIPLLENESSNFDHHDDPSFPRPPSEPPDVEVFFDFEPNSGKLISVVKNNIDELIEDEYLDPGGEIDIFATVEDDYYFPFIFVIRIFLPYLIYPEVSPLLFSVGSEDAIFDPGISTLSRWHLIGMELSCTSTAQRRVLGTLDVPIYGYKGFVYLLLGYKLDRVVDTSYETDLLVPRQALLQIGHVKCAMNSINYLGSSSLYATVPTLANTLKESLGHHSMASNFCYSSTVFPPHVVPTSSSWVFLDPSSFQSTDLPHLQT